MRKRISVFVAMLINVLYVLGSLKMDVFAKECSDSGNMRVEISDTLEAFLNARGGVPNSIVDVRMAYDNAGEIAALEVTSEDGDNIVKDVYLIFKYDEDGRLVVDNEYTKRFFSVTNIPQNSTNANVDFPPGGDSRYIIHGSAVETKFVGSDFAMYYRPSQCAFSYENYTGVSVSFIDVRFTTDGFLYSYPGYVDLNKEEYVHTIIVSKNNPSVKQTYYAVKNLPSDQVISVETGSPFVGRFLTFTAIVNGKTESYTFTLS